MFGSIYKKDEKQYICIEKIYPNISPWTLGMQFWQFCRNIFHKMQELLNSVSGIEKERK